MKKVIIFLTLFLFTINIHAQSISIIEKQDSLQENNYRKNVVIYSLIAHTIFTTYIEYKWWWEGDYHEFQLKNDWWNNWSNGVDKVGHMYTSYLYYNSIKNIFHWAHFDESKSEFYAIAIPLFYAVSIELGDGFSDYGAGYDDLSANILGITIGHLQSTYESLNFFRIKWSYFPSKNFQHDSKLILTDDYDGHIYWLSFDIHKILPQKIDYIWPKWLNLVIGYSGENISHGNVGIPIRKYAISLDLNLSSFEIENEILSYSRNIIDYFHFPAPGVRMIDGEKTEVKPILVN